MSNLLPHHIRSKTAALEARAAIVYDFIKKFGSAGVTRMVIYDTLPGAEHKKRIAINHLLRLGRIQAEGPERGGYNSLVADVFINNEKDQPK